MRNYNNCKIYKITDGEEIIYGTTTSTLSNALHQYTHKTKRRHCKIDLIKRIHCTFKEDQDHLFLQFINKLVK